MKTSLAVVLILALASAASARIWNVPGDASTIQAGIDSAAVGDVVSLAAGTYHEIGLVMKPGIALRGDIGASAVIIDGQDAGPIMTLDPAEQADPTRIEDLTFANADSGALRCRNLGDLVVERCVFAGNTAYAQQGGGITIANSVNGSVVVRDCVFADNHATYTGGAAALWWMSSVRFERCLFVRNHSDNWGAAVSVGYVHNYPSVVFDQCTFTANTGAHSGTAVFQIGWGTLLVTRSIVAGNAVGFATGGPAHLGTIEWSCNDLYENGSDDYSNPFWDFDNGDGNFSADPCFCDPAFDDYHLAGDSWCLAGHHPWGCDDLVGAYGEGCPAVGCAGPVSVASRTWTNVKDLFR
ncbi:MAG TPA: right-handed parallel beta-helix repeat-containing protein [Candidatus Krumholzibacteria bacterium]|nr:right-handed parallel beta-helix repeat-containing protein [Candidatus Krumholzibacteria bacterium]HPD70352.1 right-handed parallel beta-helix repeat-containing protein [Candidatus Krumholzibacteria bacterium]HRY39948.1 right-handed parallel beta-helix repeat-containing protein [Candidatus Krumholzibacteria bacterium]